MTSLGNGRNTQNRLCANKFSILALFAYLYPMGYVRIAVYLRNGGKRSGVRAFTDPLNLAAIREHASVLSSEALGRGAIEDVFVTELPASDPAVVSLILRDQRKSKPVPRSDGEHPNVKELHRKPPR